MSKVLPTNTAISHYFNYTGCNNAEDIIFEKMYIPDGRIMIQIVHTWGDGKIMKYGFQFKDNISRFGINPLHIVGIYNQAPSIIHINKDIMEFLKLYTSSRTECAG